MKKAKQEPAEPLLTLTPTAETTLEREGFISALYTPEQDRYPGKALIMVGGSDGMFSLTKLIAEQYTAQGLTVLALAYWNRDGLPRKLSGIPLESGEKAALWLRSRGYEKIGIWGISQGSVFALLCASYLPELFSCVVAVNPMCVCGQGFQKKNDYVSKTCLCEGSIFTFRDRDIPFAPLQFSKKALFGAMLRRREYCLRPIYEDLPQNAPQEAYIPIQRMDAPLFLLAAENDAMWPSMEAAEVMVQRLKDANYNRAVLFEHYPYASHFLLPYQLKSRKLFRVERKYPKQCAESNEDAFRKTLDFLQNHWA